MPADTEMHVVNGRPSERSEYHLRGALSNKPRAAEDALRNPTGKRKLTHCFAWLGIFLLLLLAASRSSAAEPADIEKMLRASLLTAERDLSSILDSHVGSLELRLRSNDSENSAAALLGLWLLGDHDAQIELEWWRSKSSQVRTLAAVLLLTGRDENTSNVPFLDARRFKSPEDTQRELELKVVGGNEKWLGTLLKKLLAKAQSLHSSESLRLLQNRFSIFSE